MKFLRIIHCLVAPLPGSWSQSSCGNKWRRVVSEVCQLVQWCFVHSWVCLQRYKDKACQKLSWLVPGWGCCHRPGRGISSLSPTQRDWLAASCVDARPKRSSLTKDTSGGLSLTGWRLVLFYKTRGLSKVVVWKCCVSLSLCPLRLSALQVVCTSHEVGGFDAQ